MSLKYAAPESDRGLRFLEQKLSLYVHGPAAGRPRNPALDLLTGRIPDQRVQPLLSPPILTPGQAPRTMVVALPAIGIAPRAVEQVLAAEEVASVGVGAGPRAPMLGFAAASPWLQGATSSGRVVPRIRFAPLPRARSASPWALLLRWLRLR